MQNCFLEHVNEQTVGSLPFLSSPVIAARLDRKMNAIILYRDLVFSH
jgi:hypothetical protein